MGAEGESPTAEAQRAVKSSPTFCSSVFGLGMLNPKTPAEADTLTKAVVVMRVLQIVVAVVALALGASDEWYSGTNSVTWGIAAGALSAVFAFASAVLGALTLTSMRSDAVVKGFALSGMPGDVLFSYITLSAFSSIATLSTNCTPANVGFFTISCSHIRAAAAFYFFLFISHALVFPFSRAVFLNRELIPDDARAQTVRV